MRISSAEICYFDKAPKSLTVFRKDFTRIKYFYDAIRQALINLFNSTDNSIIVVYYNGISKTVIYKRNEILSGVFNTKELRGGNKHYVS